MPLYCGYGRSACRTVALLPQEAINPGYGSPIPAATASGVPSLLFSTAVLCSTVPNAVRYFGFTWSYAEQLRLEMRAEHAVVADFHHHRLAQPGAGSRG